MFDKSEVTITYPWNQQDPEFVNTELTGSVVFDGTTVDLGEDILLAQDGDEEIDAEIGYEIVTTYHSDSFSLINNGDQGVEITFNSDIAEYTIVTLIVKVLYYCLYCFTL